MKVRYVLIICLMSLIINIVSIYNFRLGFVSLFFLLITFIPSLYDKMSSRASKVKESERSFATRQMAVYGSQRVTRVMNKIAMIDGLVVVYAMSTGAVWLQLNDSGNTGEFISDKLNLGPMIGIAQTLSKVGWIVFIFSLILVTIYTIQLMRSSAIFTKKYNK